MTETNAVDEYIRSAPEPAKRLLRELRRLVLSTVPNATEKISYGMPTYEAAGRRLLHLAAAKKHVAVYALVHVEAGVPAELAEYVDHRSTLQFPFDSELPEAALVEAMRQKAAALES